MSKLITMIAVVALSLCWPGLTYAADTEGKVSQIVMPPVQNGKHVVRIYFSTRINDRWGCPQNPGYIDTNNASSL